MPDPQVVVLHDLRLEESVLGSILINPSSLGEVMDYINSPDDFSVHKCRFVWEAILRIANMNEAIDYVTVCKELLDHNHLKEIGGEPYIMSLLSGTQSSINAGTYAKEVHSLAMRRRILTTASEIAQSAYETNREIKDIISDMLSKTQTVSGQYTGLIKANVVDAPTLTKRAVEAFLEASKGIKQCSTGLANLDKILYAQKGELITIAGRPGQGKSSLLGGIALHNALVGKSVKIFQLEAGAVQLGQRLISQLSDVSASKIMQGKLDDAEKEAYYKSADKLARLPLFICDTPGITTTQIKLEAKREKVDLIVLDYFQLARSDRRHDRRDLEIGEVVRGMKELAMELDVPVFAGAQMSRAVEQRQDQHPIMSDLRESGEIENTSDSVVFIYRPEGESVELIVGKHRQGATGSVASFFMEQTMKFVDAIGYKIDLTRIYEEGYVREEYTHTDI
jgi:replicative DNA helicase